MTTTRTTIPIATRSTAAALAGLMLAGLATPALAGPDDNTVRIALSKELDNPDQYFSSARESTVFSYAVYDPLVERDRQTGQFTGNLAASFAWIDDTTLEFRLRPGITFHNGEAFDADDVVFTLNHFADPAIGVAMPNTVNWIKSAEKIDPMTVRLHLKAPFPAALDFLESALPIYPDQYYQEVGAAGFAKAPVGTGPYRVASITPGTGYQLEAFSDYHAGGPRSPARIAKVDVRAIPDMNTQLAEMMSGQIDFMWQVPEDVAQKLKGRGGFTVTQAPTMRFGYIALDAAGRSAKDGPLTNPLVRKAINHAIDRKAVRDAFFAPTSDIINAICNPLQFGCSQDVTAYDYDPEKARALLAEAGFPDGFSTTLYAYRDRPAAEAIAQMLAKVGIKADLTFLQYAALADKQLKGEVPMGFLTWGSGSVADVSASTSKFFDGSDIDSARNPELTALLKAGDTTTDADKRRADYDKALKLIADEAYWVPLWTYTSNYVLAPALDFTPTPDEFVRFNEMGWK